MGIDVGLAIANIILCVWRLIAAFRARRLLAILWFLLAYFAIFLVPVALETEVSWVRGFLDERVTAGRAEIHNVVLFVCAFNGVLALADALTWKLFGGSRAGAQWRLEPNAPTLGPLFLILLGYWVVGSIWYFLSTLDLTYRDYVEGASWSVVFLWASSPLISLLALQRRWIPALLACVPFIYFAIHLHVRSFALLSLVPVAVVGFYQVLNDSSTRIRYGRLLRYASLAGGMLVALSIFVSQYKNGEVAFPDSKMPYGILQTTTLADRYDQRTELTSLTLYGWNYINPFMKLFQIEKPDIADVPVVIARLLEGVPEDWPIYFHYPALLWTDAYLSFGWAGLALAVFWPVVLAVWEGAMRRNPLLLALLLPYFVWHCYMLVRGAIAIASVPVAYALYFSFFAFFLASGMELLRRRVAVADSTEALPPMVAAPANLLR
jgi:hypothetical protein